MCFRRPNLTVNLGNTGRHGEDSSKDLYYYCNIRLQKEAYSQLRCKNRENLERILAYGFKLFKSRGDGGRRGLPWHAEPTGVLVSRDYPDDKIPAAVAADQRSCRRAAVARGPRRARPGLTGSVPVSEAAHRGRGMVSFGLGL